MRLSDSRTIPSLVLDNQQHGQSMDLARDVLTINPQHMARV
jgi:hypothetical protein